jgi:hypothetical protein
VKVGDLVKIVVPKGKTPGDPLKLNLGRIYEDEVLEGIIVGEWTKHWWEILRNDLGVIQRFHLNWCEVVK